MGGKITAVLVGQEYTRVEKLRGIDVDLQRMTKYCNQLQLKVVVLRNPTWLELTRRLQSIRPDYLLFYYSGHKVYTFFEFPDQYVSERQLYTELRRCSRERTLILDTCFGWSYPLDFNTVLFAASRPTGVSITSQYGSLFTKYFTSRERIGKIIFPD